MLTFSFIESSASSLVSKAPIIHKTEKIPFLITNITYGPSSNNDICFMNTCRGKSMLIYQKFSYNWSYSKNGSDIYWRCRTKTCQARIHTLKIKDDTYKVKLKYIVHNHSPNQKLLKKLELLKKKTLKKKHRENAITFSNEKSKNDKSLKTVEKKTKENVQDENMNESKKERINNKLPNKMKRRNSLKQKDKKKENSVGNVDKDEHEE